MLAKGRQWSQKKGPLLSNGSINTFPGNEYICNNIKSSKTFFLCGQTVNYIANESTRVVPRSWCLSRKQINLQKYVRI
jgi:hypothetical protein